MLRLRSRITRTVLVALGAFCLGYCDCGGDDEVTNIKGDTQAACDEAGVAAKQLTTFLQAYGAGNTDQARSTLTDIQSNLDAAESRTISQDLRNVLNAALSAVADAQTAMRNNKFVDTAKLRTAIGDVGNQCSKELGA